jgi:hypothetical protein
MPETLRNGPRIAAKDENRVKEAVSYLAEDGPAPQGYC